MIKDNTIYQSYIKLDGLVVNASILSEKQYLKMKTQGGEHLIYKDNIFRKDTRVLIDNNLYWNETKEKI